MRQRRCPHRTSWTPADLSGASGRQRTTTAGSAARAAVDRQRGAYLRLAGDAGRATTHRREIAAGIIIGHTILGVLAPSAGAALFRPVPLPDSPDAQPDRRAPVHVRDGVRLDASHQRTVWDTAIAVSHFSIAVPFILGVTLALLIYRAYAPPDVPFHAFALFLGVAMSITAFPVLSWRPRGASAHVDAPWHDRPDVRGGG